MSAGSGSATAILAETTWPQASDIEAYIRSLGVLHPAQVDAAIDAMNLDKKAFAVRAEWESRTG